MLNSTTLGIWCLKDRKWYYLESGPSQHSQSISKVITALTSRGLIDYQTDGRNVVPYKQIPYSEAQEKGYEIEPIYLNKHIKKLVEEKATTAIESPW